MIPQTHIPSHDITSSGLTFLGFSRFRNLRDQTLSLELAPVIVLGANGAGKTNLLEAISYFAPGSGLRQASLSEPESRLLRNDANFPGSWALHGIYAGRYGEFSLGTGRDPQAMLRERRISRINSTPVKSQSAFSEILALQWLTPKIARIFEESPSSRRRFLDRLVQTIDPMHLARVTQYEEAVRSRNKLLERYAPEDSEQQRWLNGLETELAGLAIAIAAARADTIAKLNHFMAQTASDFPQAYLKLQGEIDRQLQDAPALRVEESLKDALFSSRLKDAQTGQTSHGAHKSDLDADYIGRDLAGAPLSASICSSGEQKALILSVLLCAARLTKDLRKEAPILLFDDLLMGLDEKRRMGLFKELEELGAQVWLTGTEAELFTPWKDKAQFLYLEEGQISPSKA